MLIDTGSANAIYHLDDSYITETDAHPIRNYIEALQELKINFENQAYTWLIPDRACKPLQQHRRWYQLVVNGTVAGIRLQLVRFFNHSIFNHIRTFNEQYSQLSSLIIYSRKTNVCFEDMNHIKLLLSHPASAVASFARILVRAYQEQEALRYR